MPKVPELHVERETRENHYALDGESCAVCAGPIVGREVAALIDGDGARHGVVCGHCVAAGDEVAVERLRTRAASLRLEAVSIEDLAKAFAPGRGILPEPAACQCGGGEGTAR